MNEKLWVRVVRFIAGIIFFVGLALVAYLAHHGKVVR